MSVIRAYLSSLGYSPVSDTYLSPIIAYMDWYKGFCQKFHEYRVFTGAKSTQQKRYSLGMAKVVCEDFATLLLNEKVQVSAAGFTALPDILTANRFMERGNRLVEWVMALGTGAFVEFLDEDGHPTIDYIRGDMIYPLNWDGDNITECAFASRRVFGTGKDAKEGYYVQVHMETPAGYVIKNAYLDNAGKEIALPESIQPETPPSPIPLFQIIRPNTVNAEYPDSPMGASVYADAIDQLKACDIVYDSYVNEFVLGKKRLMVPMSMSSIQMQEDGTLRPVFDPNDVLIHVYQQSDDKKDTIQPVDLELRSADHEAGLQRMIDLLSKKCGLGTGRYRFDGSGAKTATEVISEQSDLYQSLKRNEKPLERAICGMVNALSWLTDGKDDVKPVVTFDDSIIEDEGKTTDRKLLQVAGGLLSKKQAIMDIFHVDEAEAKKRLQDIAGEATVTVPAVGSFMDNPDEGGGV